LIRLIPALLITFLLSGCQTSAQFERNMLGWRGQTIDAMVQQWGYPGGEISSPDGNRVYVYSNSGTYNVPQTTTYDTTSNVIGNTVYSSTYATTDGGYSINFSCTIYVEFGSDKIIKKVSWRGNNCVA
jgi:outer membrane protein assembly factor BamE (lipoprotein component of BamABCDE complex)